MSSTVTTQLSARSLHDALPICKEFNWNVISLTDNPFGKRSTGDDGKSARAALDRIQLPQEAVTRIAEIVEVGTTLIVTDKRSEEHTSELQSLRHLVCRLLLEKK